VFDHRFDADLNMSARYYDGVRSNMQDLAQSVSTTTTSLSTNQLGQPGYSSLGSWTGLNRTYGGLGLSFDGKRRLSEDIRMDWVAGIEQDYANENRQQGCTNSGSIVSNTGHCINVNSQYTRNELDQSYSRNYYAQVNWHFSDQYTVVTGVRNTNVTLLSTSYLSGYTAGQVNYAATTPVLGLTWHSREDLNVYYNNGQSFETPTLLQTAYTNQNGSMEPTFNSKLKANTSHQQELGAKWTPVVTSQVNADIFQITSNNEIVVDLASSGKTAYTNAGGTLREGIELAWREQLSENWRSMVNLTSMRATYQSNFTIAGQITSLTSLNAPNVPISAGNQLAGLPNQQLYANLQWSQNGFARVGQAPIKGLQANVEWVARSHMWADDANTAYVAGYGIFNMQVRENFDFKGINWEAFAMVNNVGNQNYVGSVIVNQTNGQYYESGLPRNWIAGLQGQLKF
jgi:iron complex outermembrane receptor protein